MKKSLLYSLALILAACGDRTGDNESTGTQGIIWQTGRAIDLNKISPVSVLDLVDSIQIVQLEADKRCFINTIEKVLFYNGKYYVLDQRQQAVFFFDQSGKFVRKISDSGRGPQEYEYLEDIVIDPYNGQLLLVVPFGSVLCFDLDGNFVSKIHIPDTGAINEIHVLDADRWLFVSLNDHQILYFSKRENQIVERLYERLPGSSLWPIRRPYAYNDSIFFSPILSNETLNMKDQSRRVSFSWDFGANNNRQKSIKSLSQEFERLLNNPNIAPRDKNRESLNLMRRLLNHYIRYTREWSRYRMAVLEYKGDDMHVVFDKQEHKTVVFRKTKEGVRWINSYFMCNQDMVITYDVDGASWIGYTKDILSPAQLQIVEAHNPEVDNPFLVIHHLKK